MKLVRYMKDGTERFGVLSRGKASDVTSSYGGFADMITEYPGLRQSRGGEPIDDASFLPPVDRRSKILCTAVNYHSHIEEMKTAQTSEPIFFAKFHASLTGPYSDIPHFRISKIMDYEGEIAVVIGKTARNVSRSEAWGHVAGYTLVNDVSARSLFRVKQGEGTMLDWFSCKAMDRSTPVGPWIVTRDEAGDFASLRIETFLNGNRVQSESASDLIFDVPKLIEYASSRVTLEPGDVISTGTPSGVGVGRKRTLRTGDAIEVRAKGIGRLENQIV
jgi:acylpyruvate hydrolase